MHRHEMQQSNIYLGIYIIDYYLFWKIRVLQDPTPFSLSIEEDCFNNDIGNSSKAPTYDLKGLKFKPAGQDMEEFITSKENILELSAIISRNWSTTIEEDDRYIRIYPDSKTICYWLQGFSFHTV
jgi:hypothetical protein